MKESAQAALSLPALQGGRRSASPANFLEKTDIHIHFPAGAIPKDGPSAGVTILTALVSLLTGIRVRSDVAMTGEATLRGLVLPVGGIKEKVLAAHRAGIKRVIMPARNEKDLIDVPEQARKELEFVFATHMDEVLRPRWRRTRSGARRLPRTPRARRSRPPRSRRKCGSRPIPDPRPTSGSGAPIRSPDRVGIGFVTGSVIGPGIGIGSSGSVGWTLVGARIAIVTGSAGAVLDAVSEELGAVGLSVRHVPFDPGVPDPAPHEPRRRAWSTSVCGRRGRWTSRGAPPSRSPPHGPLRGWRGGSARGACSTSPPPVSTAGPGTCPAARASSRRRGPRWSGSAGGRSRRAGPRFAAGRR